MRSSQLKLSLSLAAAGLAGAGLLLITCGAAAWCPDGDEHVASSMAASSLRHAPNALVFSGTAPRIARVSTFPFAVTATTSAGPITQAVVQPFAVTWAGDPQDDTNTVHIITQERSGDDEGDGHSVKITRRVTNGDEEIELEIDGEAFEVNSMEEVREILRENGIEGDFEIGFNHQWKMALPHQLAPRIRLNRQIEWPELQLGQIGGDQNRLHQLMSTNQPKAMLGVHMSSLQPALARQLRLDEGQGVLITQVVPDTPAAEAGFEEHDIVLSARTGDEGEWTSVNEESLRAFIAEQEPETNVMFQILRAGERMEIEATLSEWNSDRLGGPLNSLGAEIPGTRARTRFTQPRVFNWGTGADDPAIGSFRFDERSMSLYMEQLEQQMQEFERQFEEHMKRLHEHREQLQQRLEESREEPSPAPPVDA